MGKVLTKQYKGWVPGVILTADQFEWEVSRKHAPSPALASVPPPTGYTALVNAERMQQLEREGYFS